MTLIKWRITGIEMDRAAKTISLSNLPVTSPASLPIGRQNRKSVTNELLGDIRWEQGPCQTGPRIDASTMLSS